MDAIETRPESARAARSRGAMPGLAVIAIGVVIGLAVALGPRVFDDAGAARDHASPTPSGAVALASLSTRQVAEASTAAGVAVATTSTDPEPPDAPAATPSAAVEAFLAAEIAGRYDVSYGLLSAADRVRGHGRVSWAADHANLPPLAGFAIESVTVAGDETTVVTRTDLHPSLDEVLGLVPAHALGRWVAVPEDGGWRVGYSRSRLVPEYPADALAADAAREWVAARQSCTHAAEWSGGLVGSAAPARRLCHAPGPSAVGTPVPLPDDSSATELAAAFGPDVYAWARLVPVTAPARLDLIVAPVGERWLVVGVREASASTS